MTRTEAILKAHKMREAGEFHRKITKVTPDSLDWDVLTLACGHTSKRTESSQKLDESMRELRKLSKTEKPEPTGEYCDRCAEEWIVRNSDTGRRKSK